MGAGPLSPSPSKMSVPSLPREKSKESESHMKIETSGVQSGISSTANISDKWKKVQSHFTGGGTSKAADASPGRTYFDSATQPSIQDTFSQPSLEMITSQREL